MRRINGLGACAVVVVALCTAFASAADASTPHYYLNGTREAAIVPEGLKVPTMSWGTITFTLSEPSKEGSITCENAAGGFVENPVGGGAGVGQMTEFLSWNCENPRWCPSGAEIEFPPGSGLKQVIEPRILPGNSRARRPRRVVPMAD
jgi:hypothetical protein